MKVYCGKCTYFEYPWGGIGLPGYCRHPDHITEYEDPSTYISPKKKRQIKGNPKKINAKNDCKNFKAGPNNITPAPRVQEDERVFGDRVREAFQILKEMFKKAP